MADGSKDKGAAVRLTITNLVQPTDLTVLLDVGNVVYNGWFPRSHRVGATGAVTKLL